MLKIGKVIHIKMPSTAGVSKEEFDKIINGFYDEIGYEDRDNYLFSGCKEWDFAWINGNLYRKDYYHKDKPHFFYLNSDDAIGPDIVCECGSKYFEISYGCYEVFAKCANCGKEESIYSG